MGVDAMGSHSGNFPFKILRALDARNTEYGAQKAP